MSIASIPATYNGVTFRSRTEARWAVFFDLAYTAWLYEPEGFALPDGSWYVPDFFLPNENFFVEIKGTDESHGKNCDKLREVCNARSAFGLVFVGQPIEMRGTFIGQDCTHSSGGMYAGEHDTGIARAGRNHNLVICIKQSKSRSFYGPTFDMPIDVEDGVWSDFWDENTLLDAARRASKHSFW